MKHVLTLLFLACVLTPVLGDDARPASTNVPRAEYPRVHPDGRVSFRLTAPHAKKVQGWARGPMR
jgi:hypothetical protein